MSKKILVVDDDPNARELVRFMLSKYDCQILEASDGKEGLEMALREKDHKAIPNYTGPIIERAWPRRDSPETQTQVTIHITPRQQADLVEPPVELLPAEIVEEPTAPDAA